MPKVYNKRHADVPADAVYVGRPTKWGNPFKLGYGVSREQVIDQYRGWIEGSPLAEDAKRELRGKDLVCWCAPQKCHADVLLEIANA